ncbi:MAG: universal stress protein [Planctomycetaceae bacterium]|nr:universal stress protein [Planctomycetaceae bacterium]
MKLLIASDGSTCAEHAEQFVSRMPFGEKAHVILANVCPSADLHSLGREVTPEVNRLVDECRAKGNEILEAAKGRCQEWAGSVSTLLLDGHPARELVLAAEQQGVDAVVLGARGVSGIRRFLLGSVSENVAKHAKCSVLVVRPPQGDDSRFHPERILLAHDTSDVSTAVVHRFQEMDLSREHSVLLVHALEVFRHFGQEYSAESGQDIEWQERTVEKLLHDACDTFSKKSVKASAVVLRSQHAAETILDKADEFHADLIALGSTGRSGWERMLIGSVSAQVLRHAPCSVWLERVRR